MCNRYNRINNLKKKLTQNHLFFNRSSVIHESAQRSKASWKRLPSVSRTSESMPRTSAKSRTKISVFWPLTRLRSRPRTSCTVRPKPMSLDWPNKSANTSVRLEIPRKRLSHFSRTSPGWAKSSTSPRRISNWIRTDCWSGRIGLIRRRKGIWSSSSLLGRTRRLLR